MEKKAFIFQKSYFWLTILIFLSLFAVRLMWGPGFYSLHDDLHVAWLDQMHRAVVSRQWPPRWVPDLSFAYGYPLFNFVYPLPFYLGEIFHLTGFSLVTSLKLVFAFSVIFSGPAMYLFLRRHFSPPWSFLGALIYLFTPYRAVVVFVRGALGEALLFAFLPLALFFLEEACCQRRRAVFPAGFFLGLLILTHNIGAFMVWPFLAIYGLILIFYQKEKLAALFSLVASFSLGLLWTAYFWLPALVEQKFVAYSTVFNFEDHFPFLKQLLWSSWGYGISTWGPYDGLSFQLGLVNWLGVALFFLGLAWFVFFRRRSSSRPLFLWLTIGFGTSFFLMNIRSIWFWRHLPLFAYFQFPWRFLIMTTFLTPLMFVAAGQFLPRFSKVIFVLGLSSLFLVGGYWCPEKVFPERTDNYFLERYLPNRTGDQPSAAYLQNTEEYLRLPVWTSERPSALPAAKIETTAGKVSYSSLSAVDWRGTVAATEAGKLVFHQYFFPGWRGWLDNQPVALAAESPLGNISLSFPAGEHSLRLLFGETLLRFFADCLSLLGFALLAGGVLKSKDWFHGKNT